MARILVNLPSQHGGHPSGVALVAFNLLRELLMVTNDTYILRSNWKYDDLPEYLKVSRVEHLFCRRPKFIILNVIAEAFRMPLRCALRGIDVILNADPFGAPLGAKARITIVHDAYFKTIKHVLGFRAAFTSMTCYFLTLLGSTCVVAISSATRKDIRAAFPWVDRKVKVIHNAASAVISDFRDIAEDVTRSNKYALLVGNVTKNKSFDVAVDAVGKLKERGVDIPLVHVGRDPSQILRSCMEQGSSRIEFENLRDLNESELAAVYRGAVCLVVPSIAEGFCLPILEAQALGCPVLCSDIDVLKEVGGDAVVVFSPGSSEELSNALENIFNDSALRRNLIEIGRNNAAKFSWKRSASAYAEAIALLLPSPPPKGGVAAT